MRLVHHHRPYGLVFFAVDLRPLTDPRSIKTAVQPIPSIARSF
jgi:hypothetical protein